MTDVKPYLYTFGTILGAVVIFYSFWILVLLFVGFVVFNAVSFYNKTTSTPPPEDSFRDHFSQRWKILKEVIHDHCKT